MLRSEIRYALNRCKLKNAEKEHTVVYAKYKREVEKLGFTIADFNEEWDIDKGDTTQIVIGETVDRYKSAVNRSLLS